MLAENPDEGAKRFALNRAQTMEDRDQRVRTRTAMANEGTWINSLEVAGVGRLAPIVTSNMAMAYQHVRRFAPRLFKAKLKDFVEDDDVFTYFAKLTALLIGEDRFMNPVRWQDKTNYANIRSHISQLLRTPYLASHLFVGFLVSISNLFVCALLAHICLIEKMYLLFCIMPNLPQKKQKLGETESR
jgi:hypothetical protein